MSLQKKVILKVNNVCKSLELTDEANLLQVLRNDFLLNSPKYGCGLGECGACTVIIDGCAARSCVIPAVQMSNRQITTLEGLSNNGSMHPIQKAFIEQQAAQCGYCLSGMIMMTVALLISSPSSNEQEIKNALSGNLCRCGTHLEILRAVQKAVELTSAQDYTTLTNLT